MDGQGDGKVETRGKGDGKIEPPLQSSIKYALVHLHNLTARRDHLASVSCKKSYETQGFALDNYNLHVIQCNQP